MQPYTPTPTWLDTIDIFEASDQYIYTTDNIPLKQLADRVSWVKQILDTKNCYVGDEEPSPAPTGDAIWIRTKDNARDIFIWDGADWKLFKERFDIGYCHRASAKVLAPNSATYSGNKYYYNFGSPVSPLTLILRIGRYNNATSLKEIETEYTVYFSDDGTASGNPLSGDVETDVILTRISAVIDKNTPPVLIDLDADWNKGGADFLITKSGNDYVGKLLLFSRLFSLLNSSNQVCRPFVEIDKDGTANSVFGFSTTSDTLAYGSENVAENLDIFFSLYRNRNISDNSGHNSAILIYYKDSTAEAGFGCIVNLLEFLMYKHSSKHKPSGTDSLDYGGNEDTQDCVVNSAGSGGVGEKVSKADHIHNIKQVKHTAWDGTSVGNAGGGGGTQNGALTSDVWEALKSYIDSVGGGAGEWGSTEEISPLDIDTKDIGSINKLAKVDHKHSIQVANANEINQITANSSSNAGVLNKVARADHRHGANLWKTGGGGPANISVGGSASAGSSAYLVRADHSHALSSVDLLNWLLANKFYKVHIGTKAFAFNNYNSYFTQQIPLPEGWTEIIGIFIQKYVTTITNRKMVIVSGEQLTTHYVDVDITEVNTSQWFAVIEFRNGGILCSGHIKYLIIGY